MIELDEHFEPILATALLSAASGARAMSGVAVVARQAQDGDRGRTLASIATTSAVLEAMCDKIPGIPNRTDAAPMFGRVAAGAFIGAMIDRASPETRIRGALIGAISAYVGAQLTFRLRKRLAEHLPALPAALIEDAVVYGAARAGSEMLRRPRIRPRA